MRLGIMRRLEPPVREAASAGVEIVEMDSENGEG